MARYFHYKIVRSPATGLVIFANDVKKTPAMDPDQAVVENFARQDMPGGSILKHRVDTSTSTPTLERGIAYFRDMTAKLPPQWYTEIEDEDEGRALYNELSTPILIPDVEL